MSAFANKAEFRKVFDLLFSVLSRDERFGPRLRALDKAQRFVLRDLALTLDVDGVKTGAAKGENLRWAWNGKGRDWPPAVVLELDAVTANAFFQGKVNLPKELLTGGITIVEGSAAVPLSTLPILKSFYPLWIERMRQEGWSRLIA